MSAFKKSHVIWPSFLTTDKKNTPLPLKLVRSSLSTTEALKKVCDNLVNNAAIKLPKLVLGGGNLFCSRGEGAEVLFAGDISCLKTQNGLLRNVHLPHKSLPPPPGWKSHRGASLWHRLHRKDIVTFYSVKLAAAVSMWICRFLMSFVP